MALNALAPTSFTQISARGFAQATAINLAGAPSSLLFTTFGTPVIVALTQAAASTTATQATVGALTIVVISAASITVGQIVVGAGIAPGTYVTGIASTTVSLSQGTTAALSTTTVNFIAAITISGGIAVTSFWPVPLVIASSTFISYISANGPEASYGGFPGPGFGSPVNVTAFQ